MARLIYAISTPGFQRPELDVAELEARVTEATRTWEEELRDALIDQAGEEQAVRLYLRYRQAFPISYREDFPARLAVADVRRIEQLLDAEQAGGAAGEDIVTALYHPVTGPVGGLRFKLVRGRVLRFPRFSGDFAIWDWPGDSEFPLGQIVHAAPAASRAGLTPVADAMPPSGHP